MEKNMSSNERGIRLGAGLVFLVLAVLMKSFLLGILGVVLVATGYTQYCPAYKLLGKNPFNKS